MDKGTIEKVEKEIRRIASEECIELNDVIIFGSRAREDYREKSDIDIMLVSEDFEDVAWNRRPREFFLEWDYDRLPTPQILCYTPEEFEEKKHRKGNIVKTAYEEGVSLA